VKLMSEARRLLAAGDPQGASLLLQTAEGLAIDPAGARRLRAEAERLAEDQGAQLKLLDARLAMATGRYDEVVATAREMLETRAGREKAADVLAEVEEALAKGAAAPVRRAAAAPAPPVAAAASPAAAAPVQPQPTPTVNYGVLRIELNSESPEGHLAAWVDERQVARQSFAFYERTGLFRKRPVPGRWTTELTLWAGSHSARVLIARAGEAGQTTTFDLPMEAGALRTVVVSVPAKGAPVVALE